MGVAEYITKLLSIERYAFSLGDLHNESTKSPIALKRELSRLVAKRDIINLRKGFYIILPPRYKNLGQLPVELFVDRLFSYLNRPYYIALYSAARFHGASHQQTHKDYIVTSLPAVETIQKGVISIDFFTTANWPLKNIIQKKGDAGRFNISSRALTAADLINYQTSLGGINRLLANVEELTEEMQEEDLLDLISWYPYTSTLQRFGYLMEELQTNTRHTDILYTHLLKRGLFPVVLNLGQENKEGSAKNRWKVKVNIELSSF